MKNKFLIGLIIAALFCYRATAQNLGYFIHTGMGKTLYDKNFFEESYQKLWTPQFTLGCNYLFNDKWQLQGGISIYSIASKLTLRNHETLAIEFEDFNYEYYVGLPVLLSGKINAHLLFSMGLKPSFSSFFHQSTNSYFNIPNNNYTPRNSFDFSTICLLDYEAEVVFNFLKDKNFNFGLFLNYSHNLIYLYKYEVIHNVFDYLLNRYSGGIRFEWFPQKKTS